jgi:ectoine hydroxylase-related dioxygenase (phytanoyl-CoA dioxygenase family)
MKAKLSVPIEKLNELVESKKYIGETVDLDVLKFSGVFVLKNAFSKNTIEKYAKTYFSGDGLNRTMLHLTEVKFDDQHDLTKIISEPEFINIASQFFNGNVGNNSIRIIKKDNVDVKPVFLHQDICYEIGSLEKYSFFIPLTHCNPDNGSLILYLGTQHFGYLGEAGEIDPNILPKAYPKVVSNTQPGDVIVMHSSVWHESPTNKTLTDRVYLQVNIQDANCSTTKNVICGERTSEWSNLLTVDEIFLNSRTQRLKSLYQQVNELTEK